MSDELVIVETTYGSSDDAAQAARSLVEKGLVACCHISPVFSFYRWQGKLEEGNEISIRCKTIKKRVEEVVEYIQANHPYKVPEIIVMRAESRNQEYSRWVEECLMEKRE